MTGVEPIRVLVVDDHALFRRGLEMVLAQESDIEVVGEAGDGAEAVEKAADLLPDVVLMDVRMPRRSGIEACTAIKDVAPSTRIIMLTISDEEGDLYEAIKAGATGYLLKEISIDEVATAIRAVAGGQSLISPSMASKLLTEFATLIKRERPPAGAGPAADRPRAGGPASGRPRPEQQATSPSSCTSARTRSRTTSGTSWRSCSCTPGWRPSCTPSGRSCSRSPDGPAWQDRRP